MKPRRIVVLAALITALIALALIVATCAGQETTTTAQAVTTTTDAMTTTAQAVTNNTQAGVQVTREVEYGSNKDYTGSMQTMALDLYTPPGDTDEKRPLFILLHGLSQGRANLHAFARMIAGQGVAVANIDYRDFSYRSYYLSGITDEEYITVQIQGAQDAKAAVRFFRNPATADLYGIDPAKIFLGGLSQGGIESGTAVYLDDLSKLDPEWQEIITANGGLEGDSGNPGYDSSVSGWICLAGCLQSKNWITSSSSPMLGVYGTNDTVVPCADGTIGGHPFSGALSLYNRAISVGLTASQIYAIEGGDHEAPVDPSNSELISRIVQFVNSL
jgi:para-nitrobenzyl esterase